MKFAVATSLVASFAVSTSLVTALAPTSGRTTTSTTTPSSIGASTTLSRRSALNWFTGATVASAGFCLSSPTVANADVDTEDFIRTGMVSMPMGVSGQAGKGKPTTGVVFRDGTEVSRDTRSGDVLAEIVLKEGSSSNLLPVVTSFTSPWPLATGNLFDIECRDGETGDGAFVAVSPDVKGASLVELKDSFFTKFLFSPTGRFSFYGQPTDVKVKTASVNENYRLLDVSFSTLSQSTMTEIPRKARVVVTIPNGSSQAVMLVASASALRWKKGADKKILATTESFKATPAPQTGMKVRAKDTSQYVSEE